MKTSAQAIIKLLEVAMGESLELEDLQKCPDPACKKVAVLSLRRAGTWGCYDPYNYTVGCPDAHHAVGGSRPYHFPEMVKEWDNWLKSDPERSQVYKEVVDD